MARKKNGESPAPQPVEQTSPPADKAPEQPRSNRPAHEVRIGRVRATLWLNHHPEQGKWYSITLSRSYRTQEGTWKSAQSFGRDDLLVIAEDAKIGYPPARVWGSPTTSVWAFRIGIEKAKRLLFTGDCLNGREAVEWGLATECAPAAALDERFEILLGRIARMPINQLVMMKLLINQTVLSAGLATTQILGTVFDGIARHTTEGYAFQQRAAAVGFKQAVRERDEPFGDFGPSTFKG